MINPETVGKLKLLKSFVDEFGSGNDIVEFNQIISAFQTNETLTHTEAAKANNIYKKLKKFG